MVVEFIKYIFVLFMLLFFTMCKIEKEDVFIKYQHALSKSGKNKSELERVIRFYSENKSDSLKLECAYYLIGNMVGKGYYKYQPINSNGEPSSFNMFSYRNAEAALAQKKEIESRTKSKITYIPKEFIEDVTQISADEIIENIEYAFKTYQLPWINKNVSFASFKEYILPYRINNEPLQRWRKKYYYKVVKLLENIKDKTSYEEIATIINNSLSNKYKYIHESISYYPCQFSLDEMEMMGGGRCEDLNMVAGYMLRAAGIPTAVEFTPYWANSNYGGHSWLSIYSPTNKKFVPMNAIYDNPVLDSLPFGGAHLAKAYRNQYETDLNKKTEDVEQLRIDVTNEYLPVSQINIHVNTNTNQVLLGVLNGQYWRPVDSASTVIKSNATFNNIARNVLYCPIEAKSDGNTNPLTLPFLLDRFGKVHSIKSDTTKLTSVYFEVHRLGKRLYNKMCQLIYLDENTQQWQRTGIPRRLILDPKEPKNRNKLMRFDKVVSNAIYRVILLDDPINTFECGRPFLFDPTTKTFKDF